MSSTRKQPNRACKTLRDSVNAFVRNALERRQSLVRENRLKSGRYMVCVSCDNLINIKQAHKMSTYRFRPSICSHIYTQPSVALCGKCTAKWYKDKITTSLVMTCFNCSNIRYGFNFLPKDVLAQRQAWLADVQKSVAENSAHKEEIQKILDEKLAQHCPNCPALIYKTYGCDRMLCPACSTEFNYTTGTAYS